MLERRVTIAIADGLHARPAALFVKLAGAQPATVTIRKIDGEPVAANSILGIMALGEPLETTSCSRPTAMVRKIPSMRSRDS